MGLLCARLLLCHFGLLASQHEAQPLILKAFTIVNCTIHENYRSFSCLLPPFSCLLPLPAKMAGPGNPAQTCAAILPCCAVFSSLLCVRAHPCVFIAARALLNPLDYFKWIQHHLFLSHGSRVCHFCTLVLFYYSKHFYHHLFLGRFLFCLLRQKKSSLTFFKSLKTKFIATSLIVLVLFLAV